jgi:hypothetical protein
MMTRTEALTLVAADWRQLARDIRVEDAYASHVTVEQKEQNLADMLETADRIEAGTEHGFWLEQRVHQKITGECVALLP